jgi:hypothetical protein
MKCYKSAAKLAQAGILERGYYLLTATPVDALELREQCLVGMAVETSEDLLLDRRGGCRRILGEARGQG